MLGLEETKKLVSSSNTFTGILIAIIVVAGIAGGIYIHNLNKIIDERKKIHDEMLSLVEERGKMQLVRIDSRLEDLKYELGKAKRDLKLSKDSINRSLLSIENLAKTTKDANVKSIYHKEVNTIKKAYTTFDRYLARVDSQINSISRMEKLHGETREYRSNRVLVLILLLLGILFVILVLFALIQRIRKSFVLKKKADKKEAKNNQAADKK
jgi:hypothetical protein